MELQSAPAAPLIHHASYTPDWAILALLVLFLIGGLGLILAIIAAFSRRTGKSQVHPLFIAIAGGSAALLGIVILMSVALTEVRTVAEPLTASHVSQGPDLGDRPTAVGPAWKDEVVELYDSDTYCSTSDAARALGRYAVAFIEQYLQDVEIDAPEIVQVRQNWDPDVRQDEGLANELAGVVRQRWPGTLVNTADRGGTLNLPESVRAAFRLTLSRRITGATDETRNGRRLVMRSGNLQVTIDAVNEQLSTSAAKTFHEKPWLDRTSNYSFHPDARFDLVARAPDFTTDQHAADQMATHAAERVLVARLKETSPAVVDSEHADRVAREVIRNWMSRLLRDRFTQRLETPNGEVWRGAALLTVDPGSWSQIEREFQVQTGQLATAQTHRQLSTVTAITLLIAGIIVIVWLLNVASRGYYKPYLIAAVMVVLLGAFLLAFVA